MTARTRRDAPIFGKDSKPSYGQASTRTSPGHHRTLSPHTTGEGSRRTAPATTLPRAVCVKASPDSRGARRQPRTGPEAVRALLATASHQLGERCVNRLSDLRSGAVWLGSVDDAVDGGAAGAVFLGEVGQGHLAVGVAASDEDRSKGGPAR